MAVKEFEFGIRDYFDGDYTNGNYAGEGVVVATLYCQPDNIFGAIINVTGGYFQDEYMSGDYTVPHLSRFYLQCDIDGTYGGLIITGEYFEDNYIDGTYFHNNQIKISVDIEASKIADIELSATGYTEDTYFDGVYSEERGIISQVSATATKIHNGEVVVDALFTPNITVQAQIAGDVLIETAIDLTATASKFTGYETLQEFFAALNAQNDRTRLFDTVQTASFGEVVDGARVRYADTSLALSSTVEASAAISADNNIDITGQFTIEVNTQSVQFVDATLVNAVTVTAQPITYQTRSNPYNRPLQDLEHLFAEQLPTGTLPDETDPRLGNTFNSTNTAFEFNETYASNYYDTTSLEWYPDSSTSYSLGSGDWYLSFYYDKNLTSSSAYNETTANTSIFRLALSRNNIQTIGSANPKEVAGWEYNSDGTEPIEVYYDASSSSLSTAGNLKVNVRTTTGSITLDGGAINASWSGYVTLYRSNGTVYLKVGSDSVDASAALSGTMRSFDVVGIYPYNRAISTRKPQVKDVIAKIGTDSNGDYGNTSSDEYTLFYYPLNGTVADNNDFIADIDEEVTATFVQTASLLANYNPTIELDTTASLVCDNVTFTLFTSTAPSQFGLTADVGVIKPFEVEIDALFTPTLVAQFVKLNEVIFDSEFTVDVDADKFKGIADETVTVSTALTAQGEQFIGVIANVSGAITAVFDNNARVITEPDLPLYGAWRALCHLDTYNASGATLDSISGAYRSVSGTSELANDTSPVAISRLPKWGYVQEGNLNLNLTNAVDSLYSTEIDTNDFSLETWLAFDRFNLDGNGDPVSNLFYISVDVDDIYNGTKGISWIEAIVEEKTSSTMEVIVQQRWSNYSEKRVFIRATSGTKGYLNDLGSNQFFEWTHFKLSRIDGNWKVYIDGTATSADSTTISNDLGNYITVGSGSSGYWDEIALQISSDLYPITLSGVPGSPYSPTATTWEFGIPVAEPRFTTNIIGQRAALMNADVSATTTLTADNIKVRLFNIDTTATISATIDNTRTRDTSVDISSSITSTITAVKKTDIVDTSSMVTSLEADNVRVRYFDVAQQNYFEDDYFDGAYIGSEGIQSYISVTAEKIRPFSATISAEITQSVDYIRYRDFTPELDSIASFVAATAKIATFFINADVVAVVDATARKQIDDLQSVSAEATVEAEAFLLAFGEADITATVTAEILPDKIKNAETAISATFTSTVDAVKTVIGVGSASSEFSTVISPFRVRFNTVTLNTQADVFCDYEAIFDATIDVSSEFSGLFALGRIRGITETLEVTGFTVTVGDLIAIDAYRQLLVPAETRLLKVEQETAAIVVPSETRILEV